MDTLIGKTVGQYTILEEIGRGGMATVYSAMQLSMNRKVAIKILPPHFLHDPTFLDRFKREVEVISSLEHPHILPIFDYGEVDGMPFIAMRFLGGGSLAHHLRRTGNMLLADIEKPLTQIAQALDYAHQQGIVHRDLKPGNILLDESGNAYLSDFGIARVMGSNLTGSNIVGTPAYMSPEQAHGLPIDGRSDVYALGVVLFELITGREPFYAETPMGVLLLHINEPLPPVQQFGIEVSAAIQKIVDKATAKDPDKRFSSAGDLTKAFTAALRDEVHPTPPVRVKTPLEAQTIPPVRLENIGGTLVAGSKQDTTAREAATIPAPTIGHHHDTMIQPINRTPYLAGGFITVMIIAILTALGVLSASRNTPTVPPVPTPFRSAVNITTDDYSLSMPQRWLPNSDAGQTFTDASDINRLLHLWQADDNTAFVTLAISEITLADYIQQYYVPQEQLRLIDETTAEDGTLRRSYRVVRAKEDFGAGQMDVFFQERGSVLVVLELYTADSIAADETTLATLQLILDSLRVSGTMALANG
jgi:serine/threonine-protein kinase